MDVMAKLTPPGAPRKTCQLAGLYFRADARTRTGDPFITRNVGNRCLRIPGSLAISSDNPEVRSSIDAATLQASDAGVIENWDGRQVPAEDQIRAARDQRALRARERWTKPPPSNGR